MKHYLTLSFISEVYFNYLSYSFACNLNVFGFIEVNFNIFTVPILIKSGTVSYLFNFYVDGKFLVLNRA